MQIFFNFHTTFFIRLFLTCSLSFDIKNLEVMRSIYLKLINTAIRQFYHRVHSVQLWRFAPADHFHPFHFQQRQLLFSLANREFNSCKIYSPVAKCLSPKTFFCVGGCRRRRRVGGLSPKLRSTDGSVGRRREFRVFFHCCPQDWSIKSKNLAL